MSRCFRYLFFCIFFISCGSGENNELKNANYYIDTNKKVTAIKHKISVADSTADHTKPISTTGKSEKSGNEKNNDADKKFYLIVGSFKDYGNAKNFADDLSKNGIFTEIVNIKDDLNRVSTRVFSDKQQALDELIKYRQTHKDSTAWILFR